MPIGSKGWAWFKAGLQSGSTGTKVELGALLPCAAFVYVFCGPLVFDAVCWVLRKVARMQADRRLGIGASVALVAVCLVVIAASASTTFRTAATGATSPPLVAADPTGPSASRAAPTSAGAGATAAAAAPAAPVASSVYAGDQTSATAGASFAPTATRVVPPSDGGSSVDRLPGEPNPSLTPGALNPAVAPAATTTCAQQATIVGGDYNIQTNEWNSGLQQCITTSGTAWSVTTANFNMAANGAPATYPSIYKGCHWGNCTGNSGLPMQVSKLTSATTSWSTTQVNSGAYDVAYDLWFNSAPTTSGQPDGTEVMIWLSSRGGVQPFGSQTATASIAGLNWNVWTGQQSAWKIISYVLSPAGTSFVDLNVLALIQDAVSRGSINSTHYLIDAEAGFEIWHGGQGLSTNSFSFRATGGSATPTPTRTASATPTARYTALPTAMPTPTPTATAASSGTAKCSASIVESQWNDGFVATVTVNNTGTTATKTWKVTWTWSGNQSIVSSWNAAATASGMSATALNMTYNNAIAAGGSTAFGLQSSFTGTNLAPTLSCSAT